MARIFLGSKISAFFVEKDYSPSPSPSSPTTPTQGEKGV